MNSKQTYYRLIALWVFCEAMLGGIIHGLKLPISGLIVGSSAVICICLIAQYYPIRGAILKATIIVAIFKMMLSPQSPMPAYIAVFFQGIVAEVIFLNRRSYRLNCVLFGVIALVESGIQRLLMMTILFGMDIWKAINIFINGITNEKDITNYSYYLASGYVILHLFAGFIVGWYAGKIPGQVRNSSGTNVDIILFEKDATFSTEPFQKSRKKKYILIIIWIFLSLLFIQALINPAQALIPSNIIVKLLLRSFLILLSWIIIINPLFVKLFHGWLEKKKQESENVIREIIMLLPATQFLIRKSWEISSRKKGIKRISLFLKIVIYNSLQHE